MHRKPASCPQTKLGPGGAGQADDRRRGAGASGARGRGQERPEEAALWKASPEKAQAQQSPHLSGQCPFPVPVPVTTFISTVQCTMESEAKCSKQLSQDSLWRLWGRKVGLLALYPAKSRNPESWRQVNGLDGFLWLLHAQDALNE